MARRSTSDRRALSAAGVIVLVAALLAPRFLGASSAPAQDGLLRITATTGMVGDLAANIGGDHVTVTTLMGPGVDPHLYKPSAGDVERLSDADLIFYGGLHLEGRMSEIFETFAETGKPSFSVSDGIPESDLLRPIEYEGNFDPHIWFDVSLWTYAAESVFEHLMAIDPDHAADYEANRDAYLARLNDLDTYVEDQIATIPETSRVLITAHDAFGYFGHRYGLEVYGLQGTSTASEASANDVQGLAEMISDRQVKAIFVESSVPLATIEAVQAACRARGWNVTIGGELFSDAMGQAGTTEGTYIGMVRHNVDAIARALR